MNNPMHTLIKPPKLNRGDKVATVSLSWGGAGDDDILWRYKQGIHRLVDVFGLEVVEMPNTLLGSDYLYDHPKKRAEDLMAAFLDPSIKAIVTCIGGIESIRMLPYIDFDVIHDHPKVFIGYSDTTSTHLMCLRAGLSSIYGPTLLVDFAENVNMDAYTIDSFHKTCFSTEPIGIIKPTKYWTSEHLPWLIENKDTKRKYQLNDGPSLLQGYINHEKSQHTKNNPNHTSDDTNETSITRNADWIITGRLLGGCLEVFDSLRGTSIFPTLEQFEGSILFFETSEEKPPVWFIECALRNYGITGILGRIKGMIWGKPQNEALYDDYNEVIKKVLKEFGRADMPVLVNMNFGHTEPKFCIPYGSLAEIDTYNKTFRILESGVC